MNTTRKERTVKRFSDHSYNVQLNELTKKALPLIEQQRIILKEVGASSLAEFEALLNAKTNFVNANLSAQALGKEAELKQLQEIELKLSQYDVSDEDVTAKGNFKTTYLSNLKERFTEYYTDTELDVLKMLKKTIESYNQIPYEYKDKIIINREKKMQFNPFNRL